MKIFRLKINLSAHLTVQPRLERREMRPGEPVGSRGIGLHVMLILSLRSLTAGG